ncbi:hypothetical protein BH23ACT3_BH23ACT3_13840 [soil metagenome]
MWATPLWATPSGRYHDADRSFAEGDAMHRRLRSPMPVAQGAWYWRPWRRLRRAAGETAVFL